VPVTDLMIRDNDLVASTAGRAFWILDDLGAIQQYANAGAVKLFSPKPAYKYGGAGLPDDDSKAGQNAPEGVILDYILPELTDSAVISLNIKSAAGDVVRTYSNKKNDDYVRYPGGPSPKTLLNVEKGHNRFLWDLRTDDISPDVKNVFIYGSYAGYAVPPGKYKAELNVNGTILEDIPLTTADGVVLQDALNNQDDPQVAFSLKYLREVRGYNDEQIKLFKLGFFPNKNNLVSLLQEKYSYSSL
jgi:hypothetical protein